MRHESQSVTWPVGLGQLEPSLSTVSNMCKAKEHRWHRFSKRRTENQRASPSFCTFLSVFWDWECYGAFESNCAGDKRCWKRKVFFANSKLKNQSFLDPFLKLTCPPSTTSTAKHAGISAWLLRGLVTLSHWQHWLSPVRWLSSPCFACVKLQHQSHPELVSRLLAQPKLDSVLALAGTTVPSRNTRNN